VRHHVENVVFIIADENRFGIQSRSHADLWDENPSINKPPPKPFRKLIADSLFFRNLTC
jgi:hypothetical protein